MESHEWFEAWFDTKYYHMLYKHRNDEEARQFLDNILGFTKLNAGAHVQDLACGTGRHSIYLNSLGYEVVGLDLSKNSILKAKESESDTLHFYLHDMREVFQEGSFDAVFNLFTSFGYFEKEEDNLKVIESVFKALKPGGIFVFDYLSADVVLAELPGHEIKAVDGYIFEINKTFSNGKIQKEITINREGQSMSYTESVSAFSRKYLVDLIKNVGLELEHCFGSYVLEPYAKESSERIILIARKPD